MKNCFKYGTIGEQWEQIRSERWLNPAFENFVNSELMGGHESQVEIPRVSTYNLSNDDNFYYSRYSIGL